MEGMEVVEEMTRRLRLSYISSISSINPLSESSRGDRIRTRDLRFWRPTLYQLSYTPI